jgi:hypothetical protein
MRSSQRRPFRRERRYLKNVTAGPVTSYQTAVLALSRTVPVLDAVELSKPLLQEFVVVVLGQLRDDVTPFAIERSD